MSGATAYAMSDFLSVRLPEARGGCGQQHEAEYDDEGHKVVRCDQCAPRLIGDHASFSGTPEGVPETPDERAHQEHVEKRARLSNAETDAEIRREHRNRKAAEAALDAKDDEIAKLRAELAAAKEKPAAAKAETPAKRPPGRPRKTTA